MTRVMAFKAQSEHSEPASPETRPASAMPKDRFPWLLALSVGLLLAFSLCLRFWTRSDLWLDEALTVNISHLPISRIPAALRRDGAPPLYYVLLHFWMLAFGSGDIAVRSLSGIMGVASLPLTWMLGKRLADRSVAWVATILLATSPFAVYYDTEARMYALVALLAVTGALALVSALRKPRPLNLIAVAVITSLLLYSHYWSLYLIAVVGAGLAWKAWRGENPTPYRWALLAGVAGCITFIPWFPIFWFQLHHTGTPWATPASFDAIVHAISKFAGGANNPGRALALIFFALAGLGLFGAAINAKKIELDLRTRKRPRALAIVVFCTLGVAILGGLISSSTFASRYTAVVFIPFLVLVAMGTSTFASKQVRWSVVAAAALLGIAGSLPNIYTNRTQAGQVAAAIKAHGHAGDVIAYCPDQLGPAVSRLLPRTGFTQITFPRETGPRFVDWVNYAQVNRAASPAAFAKAVLARAGTTHAIWLAWAPGYRTFGTKCQQIAGYLEADMGVAPTQIVHYNPQRFFEFYELQRFGPRR